MPRATHLIPAAFISLALGACGSPGIPGPGQQEEKPGTYHKAPSSFEDTLYISQKAAVFYFPDSLQLENIRRSSDPADFDGIMHEYEYLVKNARRVLNEQASPIPVLEAKNVRYLLFKGPPRDSCIDLDKKEPVGLFFYRPGKNPLPVDMANVRTDLSAYFPGD